MGIQQKKAVAVQQPAAPRRIETRRCGPFTSTFDSLLCCEHDFVETASSEVVDEEGNKTVTSKRTCSKCSAKAVFENNQLAEYDATKNVKDLS